jgi:tetratricopeptide (TPR) repeat protein
VILPRSKSITIVVWILLSSATSFSQTSTEPIPTGKVVERVVVQSHPDQSYAAFLPSGYTTEKRWPTVFCLDPRARGTIAIERFVEAATELGYIVLCSNNSRNGLDWKTISQIFTDFWEDAHIRFSIDEKRTYGAGFSGGSRLASTFASRCRGCLAGVVGAGAGFPGDIAPDPKIPFAYFGMVGTDDFNYGEMWELEKKYAPLNIPYHFETFAGGHEWPRADNIKNALAWLTLHAMKANLMAVDSKFVENQFNVRMTTADELSKGQRWLDAYKAYSSVVRDFQGLSDVTVALQQVEKLKKSADLKKEIRNEEESFQRQLREAGEIRAAWLKAPDPDEARLPRHEAMVRLGELRKKKEAETNSADRRLARRIISHLLIESIESAQANLRSGDYNSALTNYELAHEADPKNANLAYEIARVYALKRQKKSALQSLEEAVSLGFKDLSRLKSEEAFASLTHDPRYQKLIATMTNQ